MKFITKTLRVVAVLPAAAFIALGSSAIAVADNCANTVVSGDSTCAPNVNEENPATPPVPQPTEPVKSNPPSPSSAPVPAPTVTVTVSPTAVPTVTVTPKPSTEPSPVTTTPTTEYNEAVKEVVPATNANGNWVPENSAPNVPAVKPTAKVSSPSATPSVAAEDIEEEQQNNNWKLPSWAGPLYVILLVIFTLALATWCFLIHRRLKKEAALKAQLRNKKSP